MSEVAELKPCPFCGASPSVIGPDDRTRVYVRCQCGTHGVVEVAAHGGSIVGVVAAWNIRPAEATLAARLAELERERDEAVFLLDEGGQAYRAISDLEVKLAKAVEALRRTVGSLDALTSMLNPSNLPTGAEQQREATVEQARRARAAIEELEGE